MLLIFHFNYFFTDYFSAFKDEIVLVGGKRSLLLYHVMINMISLIYSVGSTRIPRVKQLLKEYFDGKEPNTGINPDEAVGRCILLLLIHNIFILILQYSIIL